MTPGDLLQFSWSITFLFAACELSEMLSNDFDTLNVAFYQFDWYLLPTQTRRVFSMILGNTQQPVIIGGYAKASCLRTTFKEVSCIFQHESFGAK